MKELEVVIDKTGEIRIQVKGIKGSSCLEFTESLEAALGELIHRELTEDYYESDAQTTPDLRQRQ